MAQAWGWVVVTSGASLPLARVAWLGFVCRGEPPEILDLFLQFDHLELKMEICRIDSNFCRQSHRRSSGQSWRSRTTRSTTPAGRLRFGTGPECQRHRCRRRGGRSRGTEKGRGVPTALAVRRQAIPRRWQGIPSDGRSARTPATIERTTRCLSSPVSSSSKRCAADPLGPSLGAMLLAEDLLLLLTDDATGKLLLPAEQVDIASAARTCSSSP
jgi:hypothetical protein